ncbi:MAG: hypothetical protein DDT19_02415 [Syntrophomonadaceae bacterium]|nr:hypothetical protein [Bacillota bacterium]
MKRANLLLLYSPLNKGGLRGLFLSAVCCLLLTVFLLGCGGAGGGSAPPGSTITINPTSFTLRDERAQYTTQNFIIIVRDSEDNLISRARITISHIYAAPYRRGPDGSFCVQFYDGSTPVNSPLTVETDVFGVYNLRVDFYGSDCSHEGDLDVFSGSAYVASAITVNR